MEFLTNEKLTIVQDARIIGSNMAQTAIIYHLTPKIWPVPSVGPAWGGVAEAMFTAVSKDSTLRILPTSSSVHRSQIHCIFRWAEKPRMTREDLLKGNAAIAEEFGKTLYPAEHLQALRAASVHHLYFRFRLLPV